MGAIGADVAREGVIEQRCVALKVIAVAVARGMLARSSVEQVVAQRRSLVLAMNQAALLLSLPPYLRTWFIRNMAPAGTVQAAAGQRDAA